MDAHDGFSMFPQPLLSFAPGACEARFLRRDKRFLIEVQNAKGGAFWVHCNNSGSMLGLLRPGNEVLISPSVSARRKLPYTLELVRSNGIWVGVNTLVPNRVLRRAWEGQLLEGVRGYSRFHAEVQVGPSRIDALLTAPGKRLWIEAKNVTLVEFDVAWFPDAPTKRGQRHLQSLMTLAAEGERAACFFLVQRGDARCFGPADFIDPDYAELFWRAVRAGVKMWPYLAHVGPGGISLGARLPLVKPP